MENEAAKTILLTFYAQLVYCIVLINRGEHRIEADLLSPFCSPLRYLKPKSEAELYQ